MDWIILIFPMLVDQFKSSGQDARTMPVPGFSTSAKIAKGMPVGEMLKQLGMPEAVEDSHFEGEKFVSYKGKMCLDYDNGDSRSCHVIIKDGKIERFGNIKPQYQAGI